LLCRDPAYGIDYPSLNIKLSTTEFQHICDGKLTFEERDWKVGKELGTG